MKKGFALLLALLLCLSTWAMAETDMSYEGQVVAGETVPVSVSYGGRITELTVRAGAWVREGDPLAVLGTTRNYAPVEGTVTGLNALEGDGAETVAERYGAVLYLEPTHRYMLEATDEKAYNDSENHYIHLGERVWLSCVSDGSHTGTGMVSALTDTGYNIEVTGGEFYLGEKVDIYRDENLEKESRLGRGTVKRMKPVEVKGTGSILKLHVKNGDFVERGELLFETVDGVLDGLFAPAGTVLSPVTGVVSAVDKNIGDTVAKGETLLKVCPVSSFEVEFDVPESDVFSLREGQPVTMELYWDNSAGETYRGTIAEISHMTGEQKEKTDRKFYRAYASFTPDERIRLGMTMIVYPGAMTEEEPVRTDAAETEPEEADEGMNRETDRQETEGNEHE